MRFRTALIAATLLILPAALSAEELSETATTDSPCFVDLDGDGFDDNIRDLDSDGIPDFGDFRAAASANASHGLGVFASMNTGATTVARAAEKFGERRFCCRGLALNRGGFSAGSGFGPGAGIGSAALGKVCIGGICF